MWVRGCYGLRLQVAATGVLLCVMCCVSVTAHAKMSRLSVETYSSFITYSNRAHPEQNDDTSMPSTFRLFPEMTL